jgi:AcrR family transcriptional regulator
VPDADGESLRDTKASSMTEQTGTGARRTSKRQNIIDAAEQLMIAKGYGALTFRSVATAAGVVPGLVQYYFPTLGDLFVAVLRQSTDRLVGEFANSATSDHPLRAVWAYASDPAGSALLMQFMALANQEPAVGAVLGEGGERVRLALLDILSPRWTEYGLDADQFPPAAALFIVSAIARMSYFEELLGTTTSHAETLELVERFLDRVEPWPTQSSASPNGKPAKAIAPRKRQPRKNKGTDDARQ